MLPAACRGGLSPLLFGDRFGHADVYIHLKAAGDNLHFLSAYPGHLHHGIGAGDPDIVAGRKRFLLLSDRLRSLLPCRDSFHNAGRGGVNAGSGRNRYLNLFLFPVKVFTE